MKRPTTACTLTPEQFTTALAGLGWKQSDFARRVGITPQSVNRWAAGTAPCPPWLAEYLGAMAAIKALHARFIDPTAQGDTVEAAPTMPTDTTGLTA